MERRLRATSRRTSSSTIIQDSWRALPNLTLTFGLRHTILQTPWETNGQQVAPTIDTHAWFTQREAAALPGRVYEAGSCSSLQAGPYYGKPGFWPKSKNNIAPRFAVAYSPNSKTSIRAGAGLYYDHFGEGLINSYEQTGSFGLSTTVTSKSATLTDANIAPLYRPEHAAVYQWCGAADYGVSVSVSRCGCDRTGVG